jgi:aminopeptidase N
MMQDALGLMERCACRAAAAAGFAPPGAEDHYPPDLRLEPVHLDLSIVVDVPARRVDVDLRLRVRAKVAAARTLELDGIDFTNLQAELPEGGRVDYDGTRVSLSWDRAFNAAEEREARLTYTVVNPASGVLFSAPDSVYPDAPTFAVTDHETERARYWLASVDHPSARPTLDIHLRADERFTLLANGAATGEQRHDDGTRTAHFSQREPCPSYLTCFAVGDFVRWEGGDFSGLPIAAFATRAFEVEHLERSFRRTRDMLAFLTSRLGPYPFAKYYQFAVEGIGGAMENISLVSWDDRFLLDPVLETEERQLFDVINVHEMAHSWFGDRVVCRDFAHSWLKEGWATYMEACWLEESGGPDALAYELWAQADVYFAEADEKYRRPIVTRKYDSSFDLFDGHLYPGASLRIHMLRRMLGDEVFWPAVREYLETYAGKLVETDDFRRVLEVRSGLSLQRFFDQWFYGTGYPDLEVTFRHDAETREGTFEIVQKQLDEKTGAGAFSFELVLAFGEEGLLAHKTVQISGKRTTSVVSMERAPEVLRVDPDGRLLHRLEFNPGNVRLVRQLGAKDVRGRIQAGLSLVQYGGRQGVEAVANAFEKEPHFGVRVKWVEALGKASSEAALDALCRIAGTHGDPKSLNAVFRALGKYRDARVIEVLEARLDSPLPYRAAEAALEALGAQREAAPLPRLLAAAEQTGFGGFVQAGALRALGGSRRAEVLDVLIRALARGGVPNRVRHAAAEGLGALAATLSDRARERAIEALVSALRDPVPKVQLAAAHALGQAKAKSALGALAALGRRLPAQDASRVRRVLRDIRGVGGESARSRELEQLEERVRKLTGKVEELEARSRGKTPGPPPATGST